MDNPINQSDSYPLAMGPGYGGDKLLDEKLTISMLSSELEKLGNRMLADLESFLVEFDGSLKDIEPGTHIKIPLGAGYVSFWISATDCSMTVWLKETVLETPTDLDKRNSIETMNFNNTKSH